MIVLMDIPAEMASRLITTGRLRCAMNLHEQLEANNQESTVCDSIDDLFLAMPGKGQIIQKTMLKRKRGLLQAPLVEVISWDT
ncbi:hypothetical protein PN498_10835 [Oscillatoria sp. CS-180]|uniref:hypothetical protein n=1 Tax=Oscillatoria sp. CS-180 TaxID=3021720 RepID=UPI00232E0CE1|nr:hypothetical protein [Oscillatoria sp. CS-180]MDB9526485.1 hypothetical protein [Oscillatoria sp. CS-180]